MSDVEPLPRGTLVRYHGRIRAWRDFEYVILGPCGCERHPCPDEGCDQQLPHYDLADPWDDRAADPLTLPVAVRHARHTSLTPIKEQP